ncbi:MULTISPECIES: type I-F CRISPR-associated endoribonuclease Cas6/Csy4 [unclassified Undibacterium]|uniref:type I-F CRISPR-associated endoribonuclease Cas6/Csy4 n=1 Tax=unclassified Undibacterium TaxID=2630295 RepID=UPI002AC915B3|nr:MULTISPECIES: type I-F CRISPR-associated endoribonuclease Cas6/Csy4 [unclassified Undibacterium]MEB0139123.1 type I-F CRISPR-associated endoribonuclease Cas6/Csy4 [Undibacterium sp. CCC2.1]MEB0172897.1 type I-F CRISPR-associated endoribonuclease Cas6/Csy4 [Undibacterium sp. CCC1.1]MEB0176631.1 type I-F CRISPR-associated endoribonuclease Cas6/Csy4 [Undibacterium sp. CCC3.4]MEB0216041.1 type I-F CRISPR-associated endoribonuclease Cas6/Csy4 [Undibacterium sp. 5I2]WPX43118.1 type I-F CRISPR-ass
MKFYIDITLLPDVEVGLHFLWQRLYQQIHLALVDVQGATGTAPLAVSFPEYDVEMHQLGKKLRLLADDEKYLDKLDIQKWLARLTDYLHVTKVREVPGNITTFARFKRLQAKSNVERLARRKARREGISETEALNKLAGFKEEKLRAPFINLQSLSSGRNFRLFVAKEEVGQAVAGDFGLYGLSSIATVPMF